MEPKPDQNEQALSYAQAKAAVIQELTEAINKDPRDGFNGYFNNFFLRLPGNDSDDGNLHRQQISGFRLSESDGYSKKRAGVSSEEFFADVDKAVKESEKAATASGKPVNIKLLKEKYAFDRSVLNMTRLYTAALDVFIRLRAAGYNHKDLTA